MNYETFFEHMTNADEQPPAAASRPLQLSDVQETAPEKPKNRLYWATETVAFMSLGSKFTSSLLGVTELSEATSSAVKKTAQELRHNLCQTVLMPAEKSVSELGWKRLVSPSGYNFWQVPDGRQMLSVATTDGSSKIYGKQGLSQTAPVWRDANGSVFRADHVIHPEKYSLPIVLSKSDIASAHTNGALTALESRHFSEITASEKEMQALVDMEKRLERSRYFTPKQFAEYAQLTSVPGGEANQLLHQHQQALKTAKSELLAGADALRGTRRYAVSSFGTLIGTGIVNDGIDQHFFKDAQSSMRTHVIDGVSPLVALTRAHWAGKAATIVGAHFASRHYDADQSKRP